MADIDQLILEAATGARRLSADELRQLVEHVARAGFAPAPSALATGLSGMVWQGRTLKGSDRITPAEQHFLKHVVREREWPDQTTLQEYLDSLRRVIEDERTGIMVSRYREQWQVAAVGPSGVARGRNGSPWILVDYRVDLRYWVTAYQPAAGLDVLQAPQRTDQRWLRRPQVRRN